jgi:hypothetical protein
MVDLALGFIYAVMIVALLVCGIICTGRDHPATIGK